MTTLTPQLGIGIWAMSLVAAMTLRTTLWAGIAWVTSRQAVRGENTD